MDISLKIRDGFVASNKSPSPVKNLFLNLESRVPGLNPDSLYLNIDSIYFTIGKDYFSSVIKVKGVKDPTIYAQDKYRDRPRKMEQRLRHQTFQVKGRYSLHLLAEGNTPKARLPIS